MPYPRSEEEELLNEYDAEAERMRREQESQINPVDPIAVAQAAEAGQAAEMEADPLQNPEVAVMAERAIANAPAIEAAVESTPPEPEPETYQGVPVAALKDKAPAPAPKAEPDVRSFQDWLVGKADEYSAPDEIKAARKQTKDQLRNENLTNIGVNLLNSMRSKPGQEREIRSLAGLDEKWAKEDEDNRLRLALGVGRMRPGAGVGNPAAELEIFLETQGKNLPVETQDRLRALVKAGGSVATAIKTTDLGNKAELGNKKQELAEGKFAYDKTQDAETNARKDKELALRVGLANLSQEKFSQGAAKDYVKANEAAGIPGQVEALKRIEALYPGATSGGVPEGFLKDYNTTANLVAKAPLGLDSQLSTKDRQQIDIAFRALLADYRKDLFGASLTANEADSFNRLAADGVFSTPESKLYFIRFLTGRVGRAVQQNYLPYSRGVTPERLAQDEAEGLITPNDPLFAGARMPKISAKMSEINVPNAPARTPAPASVEAVEAQPQRPSRAPASAGKIKVSNGKKTFLITPDKLADAEADGFKMVR